MTYFLIFFALVPLLLLIASFIDVEFSVAFLISLFLWLVISSVGIDHETYDQVSLDCQMAHNVLYVKVDGQTFQFEKLKDIEKFKNLKSAFLKKERNIWNGVVKTTLLTEKPTNE